MLRRSGRRFRASPASVQGRLVALEILYLALVLFRRRARLERAELAPLAGLGIGLARIEPVFSGTQLADHGTLLFLQSPSTAIRRRAFPSPAIGRGRLAAAEAIASKPSPTGGRFICRPAAGTPDCRTDFPSGSGSR